MHAQLRRAAQRAEPARYGSLKPAAMAETQPP
eukprot:COSAG05_NODE_8326_length_714_cov_1.269919_1_plen_31_part_10